MNIADLALKHALPSEFEAHKTQALVVIGKAGDAKKPVRKYARNIRPIDIFVSYLRHKKSPQPRTQIMTDLDWKTSLFYNTLNEGLKKKLILKIGKNTNVLFALAESQRC